MLLSIYGNIQKNMIALLQDARTQRKKTYAEREEVHNVKARLIGTQEIGFLNSSTGERIEGVNIYTAFQADGVDGLRTEKFFLKESISLPKDIKINDMIEIAFNYKGKIESIQKAQ